MNEEDVLSEGFKPLKRMNTEPAVLSKPNPQLARSTSFITAAGKIGSPVPAGTEHTVWENTSWSKFERSRGLTSALLIILIMRVGRQVRFRVE